nr:hypothetical protein [Bacteroidales bacterium]
MNISKNISLAISPCPNDTFIFDALINKRLNAKQTIDFSPQNAAININTHFLDIESLNKKAFNSEFDISKLSFVAYLLNTDKYELLQAGNAIGFDCGPLLISKADVNIENISKLKIAI